MKNFILLLFAMCMLSLGFSQTIATNFTANDCTGNPHTLFSELDAGKVVILDFVMPCAACNLPSLTAYNVAQSFAATYPGRVLFYTSSDAGAVDCSVTNNFKTSATLSNAITFSDASITQTVYGTIGMPKIVVVGGPNHEIFYNTNNSVNSTVLSTAITNALSATTTGISTPEKGIAAFRIFQDISTQSSGLSFNLNTISDLKVDVFNMLGGKVKTLYSGKAMPGEYHFDLESRELDKGIYFVRVASNEFERTGKFSVAR